MRAERRLADWLAETSPALHRALRAPWRAIRPYLPLRDEYWRSRNQYNYYRDVIAFAREVAPRGGRAIDVGAGVTHVIEALDWFDDRVALDLNSSRRLKGVESVRMDFFDYRPSAPFDLVLCLQVLEHLDAPEAFAGKLFDTGSPVIISVPYKWPAGYHRGHVQDPVDEDKLFAWTRREPSTLKIVRDERARLIAVYGSSLKSEHRS